MVLFACLAALRGAGSTSSIRSSAALTAVINGEDPAAWVKESVYLTLRGASGSSSAFTIQLWIKEVIDMFI